MSIYTGGYRYPTCDGDFTDMFKLMSEGVITGSRVPCSFDIPVPDNGEDILLDTVEMTYTSDGALKDKFSRVSNTSACNDRGFLIDDGTLTLCPETCERVGKDDNAELQTLFGCRLDIR